MKTAARPSSLFANLPEPIREELWGGERLEQHATGLAGMQRVRPGRRGDRRLGPRLRDNGRVLLASPIARSPGRSARSGRSRRRRSGSSTTSTSSTSSCGRSARICRPGSTASCPSSPNGPFQGYPAGLGLAWAFVAHTDSRFDARDAPALRARLPARAAADHRRAVGRGHRAPRRARGEPAAPGRADRARPRGAPARPTRWRTSCSGSADGRPSPRRCSGATRQLPARRRLRGAARPAAARPGSRGHPGARLAATSGWRRRARRPTSSSRVEHQRQAAMNVTVRNVITSMRLMSAFDWAEFFESVSLVDAVLRGATQASARWTSRPATATGTRSRSWRAAPGRSELEVAAGDAVRARRRGAAPTRRPAGRDPGYYLIANGRPAFERELGYRLTPRPPAAPRLRRLGHAGLPGHDRRPHRG